MSERIEGKIIKKIERSGIDFFYVIQYMQGDKELTIKSLRYSTRYNKNKYKANDKVLIEITEKNKAKIIDDQLMEMDYDTGNLGFPIFLTLMMVVFWLINVFTGNETYLWIAFALVFFFMILAGVILCIKATQTVKKGTSVKGKIVSKKERTIHNNKDTAGDRLTYHVFTFEVLYNDKIYEIMDNKTEFSEKLKVGDKVDIVVHNDFAFFAKVIEESKKANQIKQNDITIKDKILTIIFMIGFFGAIIYLMVVNDKMLSNPILIIPLVLLIIATFFSIKEIDKENRKKKRYEKKK